MDLILRIKSLTDLELKRVLLEKARSERLITIEILHLLHEVELRRLYMEPRCSSLHDYCVKILKYFEGSAQRRIQTMRLLFIIPEAQSSLREGDLNLSTMSQVQVFFNAQAKAGKRYSSLEKKEILEKVVGLSKRKTEKILFSLDPEARVKDEEKIRTVSSTQTKIEFIVDDVFLDKMDRLKNLLSHINPNFSVKELFDLIMDRELKRTDPELKKTKAKTETKAQRQATPPAVPVPPIPPTSKPASRYVPAHIKQEVWQRDHGECSYKDPVTKQKCGSRHQLQVDHILPFALGGETCLENLRLLCRAHNFYQATQVFGKEYMNRFV